MKPQLDALNAIADVVMRYRPGVDAPSAKSAIKESLQTFYEFFAGAGMARAGLGPKWKCLFANDFDLKKSAIYRKNWEGNALVTRDVSKLKTSDIPGTASLVWASFPCQDLSLAGLGAGLKGDRSGTFWPFWRLMEKLFEESRGPRIIVLENVCGMLTSHEGKDFTAIADALSSAGCRFGAVVIDAEEFVPQSRQRLFIIAIAAGTEVPAKLTADGPTFRHTKALQTAHGLLAAETAKNWIWWDIPQAARRKAKLADLIEENPASVPWHTPEETERLLAMMTGANRNKVAKAIASGGLHVGAIYKRTRADEKGVKHQRAEVRFDELSGCLRTSTGGSSRQVLLIVKGTDVRSRLISSRETARLMGLPDEYELPERYNEAYHLTGDGVVVPVVRYLAEKVFEPVLAMIVSKISVVA